MEIDEGLSRGSGWSGWASWPDSIRESLFGLRRDVRLLERTVARVRSLWAEEALARVRDDLEETAETMREAGMIYARGAVAAYREHYGEPVLRSATGRGLLAILKESSSQRVLDLRRRVEVLFRTTAYQLEEGEGEFQERFAALWPVYEAELIQPRGQTELRETLFES